MKTTFISKENNEVKFKMEFTKEEFNDAIVEAYKATKNQFVIDGFRRGKAPRSIIEKHYGEGVFFEDAINSMLDTGYPQAVKELELEVIDRPNMDFEKIAKDKDLYYDALRQSQTGWHEGKEDPGPFIKYLLGIVIAAYRDFDDRFSLIETKLPAEETVRRATLQRIGRFTKQDIHELCPSLSISSVEGALRKLVAAGELKREGTGKNTCYYRLK